VEAEQAHIITIRQKNTSKYRMGMIMSAALGRDEPDWGRALEAVAFDALGKPTSRRPGELRFGTKGSLSVKTKTGLFHDFETDEKGGLFDFVIYLGEATNIPDAARWLENHGYIPRRRRLCSLSAAATAQARQERAKGPTIYLYDDEGGTPLYRVLRHGPGKFTQERLEDGVWKSGLDPKDGNVLRRTRRVPYHMAQLLAGKGDGHIIHICEGEKDCDTMRELGYVATTNSGGAANWLPEFNEFLRDAVVVIHVDNDVAGRKRLQTIGKGLIGIAKKVRALDIARCWPECPEHGDVTDFIDAGGSPAELEDWIERAPEFEGEPWDEPDFSLLDDRRGILPDFPIDVFSDEMQQVIRRNAGGAGVTPAHVVVPLIGVVSGLIGAARRVKVTNSWIVPATCWTNLIGYSGTGKTPGLEVTRRALKRLESDGALKELERERKHETMKAAAKAQRKVWEQKVEEAANAGTTAPVMPRGAVDPGKFIPMRLFTADATTTPSTGWGEARFALSVCSSGSMEGCSRTNWRRASPAITTACMRESCSPGRMSPSGPASNRTPAKSTLTFSTS
jgi:hypothetical protein